jgi:hypothetical protein
MVFSSRQRAKRWVAAAFCVLMVVGSIAPSQVQANCGHDVTSNVTRSTRDSFLELQLLGYSAKQGDMATAVPKGELPCSGPSCSQRRGFPPAPAQSIPVRISDLCCCTTSVVCWDDPDSAEELTVLDISHPCHNASTPDRPPRNATRAHSS